ncbi:MAG: FeoA family protein [Flavobacteriales bacterium]|nr:FeoA family protein [Flavobacteriales bacterium]
MSNHTQLLATFNPGEAGVVSDIAANALTPKITEMGLFAGKNIRVLFRAPFGGPMAVDVEGYVLSLRQDEAQLVSVIPN